MQDLQQRFQMMKRQEAAGACAAGPGEFPTTKSSSILSYPKLEKNNFFLVQLLASSTATKMNPHTSPPPNPKKTKEQKELALQSERWTTTQPTS
jgi:hypothetical protein